MLGKGEGRESKKSQSRARGGARAAKFKSRSHADSWIWDDRQEEKATPRPVKTEEQAEQAEQAGVLTVSNVPARSSL